MNKFNFDGGMITFVDDEGRDCCLGYLMNFPGHGVFDATCGQVDVTPEQAEEHNKVYDRAIMDGLDNCPVGRGGYFYFSPAPGGAFVIKTFMGTLVGTATRKGKTKKILTMSRGDMVFEGRLPRAGESGQDIFMERMQ